jgi:glycosyltransferase involved in cell wall biosynthesis
MADDARDRFGVATATVHLGFDADESDATAALVDGQRATHLRAGRHSLVYTGSMAYSGQSPAQFLEGLRHLRRNSPTVAEKLDVVFAGPTSIQERALFAEPDVAPNIRLIGNLPRAEALALQRAADTLLVIIDDTRLGITTNKVFEYLAAGRPIIVLGAGSEAGRLVEALGAGVVVPSDDPPAIAAAIRSAIEGKVPAVSRNGAFAHYSHGAVAQRFAQVIDECVAAPDAQQ